MKYILLASLLLAFAGCTTLKKCERKFSRILTDTVTVRQQVTVTIPKDSAVLKLVTDTTTVIREVRQGRALVRIVREPTYTTVFAQCDSAAITKEAILKVPRNTIQIGVSKFYKVGFWVVLALLLLVAAAIYLSRIFTISISKK